MYYPGFLYWKWDDQIFEVGAIERKVKDICSRTSIDTIFVSVHWIKAKYLDPRVISAIEKCCSLFHAAGRKFMVELDIRNEAEDFFEDHSGQVPYFVKLHEADLDSEGRAIISIKQELTYHYWRTSKTKGPQRILNAWCFERSDDLHFKEGSLKNVLEHVTAEETGDGFINISINIGEDNAGKNVLVASAVEQIHPDLFSPALYEYYGKMFKSMSHIPLDGVGVDEWGYDVILNLAEDEKGEMKRLIMEHFSYSDTMDSAYLSKYGRSLKEDVVYFRIAPDGNDGLQIKVINDYINNYRGKMAENEAFIYDKGKETFGSDTFIGVHPTWWGSRNNLYFEVLKNGLDWWEVKRDFTQTDEMIPYPIRLALAHKWGSPVWYNMWYSMGSRRLETYFGETWNNVRYGGRTHYLGYECPNEDVVLELKPAGMLEKIEEMDSEVRMLDRFQQSQPDSRILFLFGMESVCNWKISDPEKTQWEPQSRIFNYVLDTVNEFFEKYGLCDFVPSSEIVNGSLMLTREGRVIYGTQVYDAVVMMYPEGMPEKCFEFIRELYEKNGKLIVVGEPLHYSNGLPISRDILNFLKTVQFKFDSTPGADRIADIMKAWSVPFNKYENGCVFQDGSIVFTSSGQLHIGNELSINQQVGKARLQFKGHDMLAVRFNPEGQLVDYCTPHVEYLRIDGVNVVDTLGSVSTAGRFSFLRTGEVTPSGWLSEYFRREVSGFAGKLGELCSEASSDIFAANRVDSHYKDWWSSWWNGETEGNWIDGLVRLAYTCKDPDIVSKVEKYIKNILDHRSDDGYIGIYLEGYRYGNGARDGELWCQSRIMLAMLAYYEATGDEEVLDAIYKSALLTVSKYGPAVPDRSYYAEPDEDGSKSHGLTIIEPMLILYGLTGDKRILDFCVYCYDDYCAFQSKYPVDDCRYVELINSEKPFIGHGPHTCEQIRIPLLLYYHTGNEQYRIAYEKAYQKIEGNLTLGGSCKSDEMIGSYRLDVPQEEGKLNLVEGIPLPTAGYEYCSTTELMLSYQWAFMLTGQAEYADSAEKIAYNAAMAARLPDGKAIQYLSADNMYHATKAVGDRWDYSPTHTDAAVCCAPNAGRLMPYHVSRMWMETCDGGVAAVFYGPCKVRLGMYGKTVEIEEKTDYPFNDNIQFKLAMDEPVHFRLLLRVPGWCRQVEIKINGESIDVKAQSGFIAIARLWEPGDEILLVLPMDISVEKAVDGTLAVTRGPLVYSYNIKEVRENYFKYDVDGFYDINFEPDPKETWEYTLLLDGDGGVHPYLHAVSRDIEAGVYPWEESPVEINATALNSNSQPVNLKLVPMGCTTLRRTAFPYVCRKSLPTQVRNFG